MPNETEAHSARSDLNVHTYQFLNDVWENALRHAEASIYTQTAAEDVPSEYNYNRAADPSSAPAPAAPSDTALPMPLVDATRMSPVSRTKGKAMVASPLPREPALVNRASPASPVSASMLRQPQRPPVLRRPPTNTRNSWMKVEPQPNLKRNGYTSHRGVAWVVQ
ncbi:hypothetical protein ABB37_02726 [Leptomonas pyrrhocoris]|uniref:Uncharacterized protein n=1 Tax=Leptomonas pyrrhocoris TaxID=157538 RepID=A0A0M9G640_LEPPY|nr:hypothetical protein ABB37_02726 [Leptomonas pyrrhocoris]XP_015661427.1 hypothetical protein ABB37_02726 [Leptomonas pyrrhocoris]XP_015661428.1 hypothetical protein ABB37_02726 [Leptomonas pyrrhocoris]KPA82987.1 hypothetical protein ABB37_02726 [Leptomonas pyrrhocoris]KPA82988.1 hypothetical protein ABB37_02726 [Leptomonas pyrrhocoris]KPA82989.1 hypothetical protein ABB37_02726 [Leptomonas pyrrhocoris]|eukprot:XP_015661426.1 hypothetical protein ABB37_02726 [Leptomonas pyrrhocoris]